MVELPTPETWPEVKRLATGALEDNLAFLRRTRPGLALTQAPQTPVAEAGRLVCQASRTGVQWTAQQYFLVLAGTDPQVPDNRYDLALHSFRGQRLTFDVPERTRAMLSATGSAPVWLHYVDDTDVQLKTRLLAALRAAEEGPLVPQLWWCDDRPALQARQLPGESFNEGQQLAFGAMTGDGAFLIWGPPGTGKTKVISAAVADALRARRSVLIASHTHVAVDNVLEKLMTLDVPVGTLIRVAGRSQDKVADSVTSQGTLLLEQAAAVLTRQQERLQALEARERELRGKTEAVQGALTRLDDQLGGVDVAALEAAAAAVAAGGQLPSAYADLQRARLNATSADSELTLAVQALAAAVTPDRARRQLLEEEQAEARTAASRVQTTVADLEHELAAADANRRRLKEELGAARARVRKTGLVGRLVGAGARREQLAEQLSRELNAIEVALLDRTEKLDQARVELATAQSLTRSTGAALAVEDDKHRLHAAASTRVDAAKSVRDVAGRQVTGLAARLRELESQSATAPEGRALLQRAEAEGLPAAIAERERMNEQLAELQALARGLEAERRKIEDEFTRTRDELLRTAPVIACTLTALTTQRLLLQRSFDVVIVDEVANAHAAQVVLAASKGRRMVALVGDFLQNAPIAETDDPVGDAGAVSVAWQREDVFTLADITDRASAQRHGHCVALSVQYRYPSIIADMINEFCYEGLLESARKSTDADGPTVTFIDTAEMPDYALVRRGSSWTSPGGLNLLVALARHESGAGGAIGFVTPYAAQARAAQGRTDQEGLDVLCGTSHTFQGKEVPVLILDLMQDREQRWVGKADLHGGRPAVSAAKLLNVALTRMQQRIYLLGNWTHVSSSSTPGMKAIAAQQGRPNFRLIPAARAMGMG